MTNLADINTNTLAPVDRPYRFGKRLLPVVLQTETAECGLACLTMVAAFHGQSADLRMLRQRFQISTRGMNLARIMEVASEIGMTTRALRLEIDQLENLEVPALLHWNLNHFVVLKKISKRSAVIHDPAVGAKTVSLAQLSKHFTGVALELHPSGSGFTSMHKERLTLKNVIGEVKGVKKAVTQIFLLALSLELFAIATPFYMQWVVDQVLVSADLDLLTVLAVAFALIVLLQSFFSTCRTWSIARLSSSFMVQWSTNLFAYVLRLPLSWFEKRHTGDIVSRFASLQTIQRLLTTQFVSAILDGLMSIATLCLLFFYSAAMASVIFGAVACYAALRALFFNRLWQANEAQVALGARQQTDLLESIRSIMTMKLNNLQPVRRTLFFNDAVSVANSDLRVQLLNLAFTATNFCIFGLSRVAVIWIAALAVLEGSISAGMLIAFLAFVDQFSTRATGLVDKVVELRMLRLHLDRLADITQAVPESECSIAMGKGSQMGARAEAMVHVRGLSFRYSEQEPWIVRNCSFRIDPGESVAIVGPSGCGKTTLAKLLLGLFQPTAGDIRLGGIPIGEIRRSEFCSTIASVMQDDTLFTGSIFENISLFDSSAGLADVRRCAQLAAIDDEILSFPMGYDTQVGDMGSSLSGGQKQRVLIARALYRRPSCLILDEATSHLDVDRERLVNAAISQLKITRIILAHRQETIESADRVLDLRTMGIVP